MTDKQANALASYVIGVMPDMSDPEIAEMIQPFIDTDNEIDRRFNEYIFARARKLDWEIMSLGLPCQ